MAFKTVGFPRLTNSGFNERFYQYEIVLRENAFPRWVPWPPLRGHALDSSPNQKNQIHCESTRKRHVLASREHGTLY